jgi:hypothetical protein
MMNTNQLCSLSNCRSIRPLHQNSLRISICITMIPTLVVVMNRNNEPTRKREARKTSRKTCSMLVLSFVGRTCVSFARWMIVSVTVCQRKNASQRNRRNLTLLSSNSILAVVTTSLFSSVFAFSSLILSIITIERIAYAIE